MSIKQVTVFGGSGFVGRAIVRALAQQGYLVRVAVPPHRARRAGQDGGRCRPGHADAGQPAHAASVAARGRRQPGRDQCRRHSLPARPPALSGRPCRRRPRHRRGGPRGRRRSAWSISRASAPTSRSSKNRYIQSKVEAEDAIDRGLRQRHHPAAQRGVRPRRRAVQPPGQRSPPRRRSCRWSATARPRSSRCSCGDVGAAAAAVLARPETAKSVFELGGPRVYTYREIAALVLREIDRHKPIIGVPAGLMKIAGFFAEISCPVPPLTHDQVDLLTARQCRARRRQDPGRPRHRSRPRPRSSCRPISTASASAAATTSTLRPDQLKERLSADVSAPRSISPILVTILSSRCRSP